MAKNVVFSHFSLSNLFAKFAITRKESPFVIHLNRGAEDHMPLKNNLKANAPRIAERCVISTFMHFQLRPKTLDCLRT